MAAKRSVEPRMERHVWPLDKIIEYPKNPRTHPPDQLALLANLLRKFGPDQDIVVDEHGVILKGHGRKLAAAMASLDSFPVTQRFGLSDSEKQAIRIADNQVALLSGWDTNLLQLEVKALQLSGFDLPLLGFPKTELLALTDSTAGLAYAEAVPEPPKNPISRRGDVWALGRHRIGCGDSTSKDDVERVLDGEKPHLMVTDPPYGVEYDPALARAVSATSARGKVLNDDRADWRDSWALFGGDVAYVWHAGLRSRQVVESLEAADFTCRAQIIWDKTRPIMSRGHYHFQHEPCWYAVRNGATAHWAGDRKQSTVWPIAHRESETGHGTQKPVECMKRPIENNSKPGDAVYEPFSGSGTTIIAAEMTGRRCFAIELSPAYVDMAVMRWEKFTGLKATLDGKTYDEVKRERSNAKGDRRKPVRGKGAVAAERDQALGQRAVRKKVRPGRGAERREPDSVAPVVHATGNPAGQ